MKPRIDSDSTPPPPHLISLGKSVSVDVSQQHLVQTERLRRKDRHRLHLLQLPLNYVSHFNYDFLTLVPPLLAISLVFESGRVVSHGLTCLFYHCLTTASETQQCLV